MAWTLDHAALTYAAGKTAADADASVALPMPVFNAIVLRQTTFADAERRGELTITGKTVRFAELLSYFDDFDPLFPIVEPRRSQ